MFQLLLQHVIAIKYIIFVCYLLYKYDVHVCVRQEIKLLEFLNLPSNRWIDNAGKWIIICIVEIFFTFTTWIWCFWHNNHSQWSGCHCKEAARKIRGWTKKDEISKITKREYICQWCHMMSVRRSVLLLCPMRKKLQFHSHFQLKRTSNTWPEIECGYFSSVYVYLFKLSVNWDTIGNI